jgi:putative copper export protein
VGSEFRGLVTTAIAVLLLTGAILTVSRLTEDTITTAYIAVLVVKVTLALYMFYVVRFLRTTSYPVEPATPNVGSWWGRASSRISGTTALLVMGIIVIGLSDVLNALLEDSLVG